MSDRPVAPKSFADLIAQVTEQITGKTLDAELAHALNRDFPAGGSWARKLQELCVRGCEEGWLCARAAGGIRYGRVLPAADATHGYSVDVVDMENVAGPHHRHPNGEIDFTMPLEGDALFDSHGAGWLVYAPDSAHRPTVSQGRALVLYLLPGGEIEFTRN